MLRLVAAEMVHGPKKEMSLISATSCTKKSDIDYCLIREIEMSAAKLHNAPVTLEQSQLFNLGHSQVDLSNEGEIVFKDRGYFGVWAKGIDFTMKRKITEKPLGELDKERNT